MLKDQHDGSILKPAYKALCGPREIQFYEQLQNVKEPSLVMLKELVPDFRGIVKLKLGERRVWSLRLITHQPEFLILNLSHSDRIYKTRRHNT